MVLRDYDKLAIDGMPATVLANLFLKDYYADKKYVFPINPFQILKDLNIPFILRPFKNYEGIYIPADSQEDIPIVGINLNRPITRQRFSAAHELCHHLKDANNSFMYKINGKSSIERYAESFASELLMPSYYFKEQTKLYIKDGYIDFDGVLKIANFFGVSFKACLNKLTYEFNLIDGNTSPIELDERIREYKPQIKRKEFGMSDVLLYEQLYDAIGDNFNITPSEYACNKFKTEYVFYDSRMEGIKISIDEVANIVTDLRLRKQNSKYCNETNQNIIEVAGLTLAYDYVFSKAKEDISIYETKHINEKIYSTAPCPEYGGQYRQSNTLVLGAKFETIDYNNIPVEMMYLGKKIDSLLSQINTLSYSRYIEEIIKIHHKLTVIHAFRDGNGRTSRAFSNMLLLRRNISPVFFDDQSKAEYKRALKTVDLTSCYDDLYIIFFKTILKTNAILTDFNL